MNTQTIYTGKLEKCSELKTAANNSQYFNQVRFDSVNEGEGIIWAKGLDLKMDTGATYSFSVERKGSMTYYKVIDRIITDNELSTLYAEYEGYQRDYEYASYMMQ